MKITSNVKNSKNIFKIIREKKHVTGDELTEFFRREEINKTGFLVLFFIKAIVLNITVYIYLIFFYILFISFIL